MRYWKKLTHEEISARIFSALGKNVDYKKNAVLGVPASHLDDNVFFTDPSQLSQAPFLSSLVKNPNHIGCHTLGDSEPFFKGTHDIEREVINLCAEDILNGEAEGFDGYIASGGTEANIQAIWMYRNLFVHQDEISSKDIVLLFSEDAHYSMFKAANLLNLTVGVIKVDEKSRALDVEDLKSKVDEFTTNGHSHFIVVANMMTTMFGSVDDIHAYTSTLKSKGVTYRVHIDGAYGGFVYPVVSKNADLTFSNPEVSSVTLDAHKMVQAPYGTGIFICRKDLIHHVMTNEAQYVQGMDLTLSGSRSGANAISVWMILQTYGPYGWHEKIHLLNYRTDWLEKELDALGVQYHRTDSSNIVTMRSEDIPDDLAHKYGLVPDSHNNNPKWYKIVIMDHVTLDSMQPFITELAERKK
ncbi:MAG: pyridoxal-dependent decarboxylase [Schleiferiaceae bacterium]|jgi:glutamate/tyrosine decarboxylase-like PLP-dependent enzyme|nr:pyridoxal-dependent decarboxylase [Schleiferiaceae bacterium]